MCDIQQPHLQPETKARENNKIPETLSKKWEGQRKDWEKVFWKGNFPGLRLRPTAGWTGCCRHLPEPFHLKLEAAQGKVWPGLKRR